MSIIWPCAATLVSDSFDAHRNRRPPSTNPGTDIGCGYGAEVWAVGAGVVTSITNDTNSAAGRYLTIALDSGEVDQKLHLSKILVSRGQRVAQRQTVALSGASGFGSEWGYGPHLHQTFRVNGSNVDFQKYVNASSSAASGAVSFTEPPKPQEGDQDMITITNTDGGATFSLAYQGVTYHRDGPTAILASRVNSTQDEIHELTNEETAEMFDTYSIPRQYMDPNQFPHGGWGDQWSRELEIQDSLRRIGDHLGIRVDA